MTPAELNKELKQGRFQPVYYFYGVEDYRIKEAEKAVANKFLPKSLLISNYVTLSASKMKIIDILNELSVYPMLGENQVFTISDIQSQSPENIKKILSLLTPADPKRIVILSSPSSKTPKKKSKMLGLLSKKATAVEFNRISGNRSERRIVLLLNENQVEIESEALKMLVVLGGGDMGGLLQEANKLIDYIGPGGKITLEDVKEVTSDYQAFAIYELADQIAVCHLDRAFEIVNFLLKKGENCSKLLFLLSEHFIDLYFVQNNKPLPPARKGIAWKYNKQINLFTNNKLEAIIEMMAQAGWDLRNGIKPEKAIIENLILNVCRLGRKTSNV